MAWIFRHDRATLQWLMLLIVASGCAPQQQPLDAERSVGEPWVQHISRALQSESLGTQVHAAEFLLGLDYRTGVREHFVAQQVQEGETPENRIGIYRVLAEADRHRAADYAKAIDNIQRVFLDPEATDRIHALEALAKLNFQLADVRALEPYRAFAAEGPPAGRAFAWWLLLNHGDSRAETELATLLTHPSPRVRQTAAYVLRHQPSVRPATRARLEATLAVEPATSSARAYLATACWKHRHPTAENELLRRELLTLLKDGNHTERFEVTRLAADVGDGWVTELEELLAAADISQEVRASAAHALCRIQRRQLKRMPTSDWLVVGGYGLVMLAVGIYYARRTGSAADFLLGGRTMRPWMIGLSLFATLLSTLSYLAWPGEMIKHGPIIMMGYASYPLVFVIVGWFLIPQIMKLRVTSAYEILELRLGISVRLLGSLLFLSLRFLWMASIIYWTTAIVLLPAAGLDARYAARCAMLLGLVTVIYTSLGGLRAVVLTDVIQTLILFTGAIASLWLITNKLGGVEAWMPTTWAPHWSAPRIWFDMNPSTRSTLANAMLSTFAWYVCTAGADQMAIQRYLATRDVRSARRSLAVSMTTEITVISFLGLMGLALLAFFSVHPDRMADGQTVYTHADKLFPRFVVVGLPVGMSGLVVAGLLAAAMSSLSSGVNSSAAVISEDFVRRFRKRTTSDRSHVRLVRWTSLGVGVIVVALSSVIGQLQGNMLEVVYKVVNLFTAPLFYLFFMAIFVRSANTVGTWIGALAGIATAILIAFWQDLFGVQGISFLWIMPSSFVVSVMLGTLASVLSRASPSPSRQ